LLHWEKRTVSLRGLNSIFDKTFVSPRSSLQSKRSALGESKNEGVGIFGNAHLAPK
jgi:hypothetical protein